MYPKRIFYYLNCRLWNFNQLDPRLPEGTYNTTNFELVMKSGVVLGKQIEFCFVRKDNRLITFKHKPLSDLRSIVVATILQLNVYMKNTA